jgi:hypothetical protein
LYWLWVHFQVRPKTSNSTCCKIPDRKYRKMYSNHVWYKILLDMFPKHLNSCTYIYVISDEVCANTKSTQISRFKIFDNSTYIESTDKSLYYISVQRIIVLNCADIDITLSLYTHCPFLSFYLVFISFVQCYVSSICHTLVII